MGFELGVGIGLELGVGMGLELRVGIISHSQPD